MSRSQKILTTALWALLVVIMVSVIGAGWWRRDTGYTAEGHIKIDPVNGEGAGNVLFHVDGPRSGDVLFTVPTFALVDQNDRPVTDQTLRGKPWVAAFIFTNCAGPCPMMSSNMAKLQERVPHPDLRLVSFTVDPERDTPKVLKRYATNLKADESRWSFLTGSPQAMADVARGMLLPVSPATESEAITHSTKFLLVDPAGGVRGVYSSDAEGMEQLAADSAMLVGATSAPTPTPAPTTRPEGT